MTVARDISLSSDDLELKAATRETVSGAGGQEAVAAATGRAQSVVSDWGSRNTASFIPANAIAAVEARAVRTDNWPPITRALARRQGFVLLAVPQMGSLPADWHTALGSMVKEVGDVTQRVCLSLADGHVCETDGEEIDREIGEAIEKMVALRALSRAARGLPVEVASDGGGA